MNNKILDFKNEIKDKKVAVIGIGISNTPLIKYLHKNGAKVTAFDKKERSEIESLCNDLSKYVAGYSLGSNYLSNLFGFDFIFRTPGMRYDLPEFVRAQQTGSIITSEMELFMELCPVMTIGITGSDGKTTTTTLIYNMLKEAGHTCWVGGNIGTPLLDKVEEMKETDKVILELSSFQLHTFKKSPNISIITNISPNHLDYHTSYDEYIEAKTNIFNYQTENDKLILNYDNDVTRNLADRAKGKVVFFSRKNDVNEGFTVKNGVIIKRENGIDNEILKTSDILIPGVHNIENYMTAIAATDGLVSKEHILKVATTFPGVEHRIELVRELNGIKFYNSSIDSSPNRTIATLNTFNQKVILIAGGKDKNIPFDDIGKAIIEKVKCLLLIGATAPKIEKAFQDEIEKTGMGKDIPIFKCSSYEEIVKTAFERAKKGDIILLSPASTSFDMFPNFEARGRLYKELVNKL